MVSYTAPKKSRITPAQRLTRVDWCYEDLSWSANNWSNVVFTDENSYEMLNWKKRIYVHRFRLDPTRFECLQLCVHRGGEIVFMSYTNSSTLD